MKGSNWQQLFWQGINWQYVSEALVNSAIQDYRDEPQISLEITNKAFDIALRGFVHSWRIYGWDSLTISEIIEEMNYHEDEWARFWWWNNSDPTNTETSRDENNFWFVPPMKISDLYMSPFEDKTPQYTAQYYAVEVKEMVKSFIYRTPMLDLKECVIDNWNSILGEMKNKYHDLDIPAIDFEVWVREPFYDRTIIIRIKREYEFTGWAEEQKQVFLKIVSRLYGENLDYMKVDFTKGIEI